MDGGSHSPKVNSSDVSSDALTEGESLNDTISHPIESRQEGNSELQQRRAERSTGSEFLDEIIGVGENGQNKTASTEETETSLLQYSDREASNLLTGKKNRIIQKANEIKTFVKDALKGAVERGYMGILPDRTADFVLQKTGMDVKGYNAILNSDNTRHIFKKHGDPAAESERGQINVTEDDIALLPRIIAEPDDVRLSDKLDDRGRRVLVFEKDIGNRYITVQAVVDGNHSLQTDTMYIIKKNSQDTGYNVVNTDPIHNAQSEPSQSSSIDNIPHASESRQEENNVVSTEESV